MVWYAGAAAIFKSLVTGAAAAAGFHEVLKIIANFHRVAFMNHWGSILKHYMQIFNRQKKKIPSVIEQSIKPGKS